MFQGFGSHVSRWRSRPLLANNIRMDEAEESSRDTNAQGIDPAKHCRDLRPLWLIFGLVLRSRLPLPIGQNVAGVFTFTWDLGCRALIS